jgi:hypothetical protein
VALNRPLTANADLARAPPAQHHILLSLVKVCQRSVDIRAARSRDRAIEAAKKRFARLEHVGEWWLHARLVEIEAGAEAEAGGLVLANREPTHSVVSMTGRARRSKVKA